MKRILNIFIWCCASAVFIGLVGFIDYKGRQAICRGLIIETDHPEGVFFVNNNSIRELILHYGYVADSQLCDIDIAHMESFLTDNPFIRKANVYQTIDGYTKIQVHQKIPLLRVINANGESYYIDSEGWLMPLSDAYTANVLVATGNIHEPWALRYHTNMNPLKSLQNNKRQKTILNDLYALAIYIHEDAFFRAQITQIYVDENKEINLIPRVGNHRIIIGDVNDLENKMNNLKVFYKKGLKKTGWNKYSIINLKYSNQIVCTIK